MYTCNLKIDIQLKALTITVYGGNYSNLYLFSVYLCYVLNRRYCDE